MTYDQRVIAVTRGVRKKQDNPIGGILQARDYVATGIDDAMTRYVRAEYLAAKNGWSRTE